MSAIYRKKNTIIVDLDGTLALDDHRNHLLHQPDGKRDWDAYFALCGADAPNEPVIELCRAMFYRGYFIRIFTGRSDSVEDETRKWLDVHDVQFDSLTMREKSDRTDDHELKPSWAETYGGRDSILFVVEDRERVVHSWRSRGYTVFQCAPGKF